MNSVAAIKLFSQRPISTALLAIVVAGLGFVFVIGWVPDSPNRRYFPGHEWLIAAICWGLALFFGYCCYLGFRDRREALGASMKPYDIRLKHITATLSKHHQRATYGAVGGLLGRLARSVMSGQPKSMGNSWVVSAKTGKPTGYTEGETHPNLESNARIITTSQDLAEWLRTHS